MAAPPTVRRFADLDALSRATADDVIALARAAVAARGACHLALSGGSTPRRMFQLLADAGAALAWQHIHLWWIDERTVGPEHPESNYGMARDILIAPLGLDPARVHRMLGELADHDAAAQRYERELVVALGSPPVLDIALLGMGPDGHTASLFPGTPAVHETRRWAVANVVTSPLVHGTTTRLTVTAPTINAARHVRFEIAGTDKAATFAQVLEGARDPARLPAQLIAPASGDLVWFVEEAVAAQLRGAA